MHLEQGRLITGFRVIDHALLWYIWPFGSGRWALQGVGLRALGSNVHTRPAFQELLTAFPFCNASVAHE